MARSFLTLLFCILTLSSYSQERILNKQKSIIHIPVDFTSSDSFELFCLDHAIDNDNILRYTIFDHDLNIIEEFSYNRPKIDFFYNDDSEDIYSRSTSVSSYYYKYSDNDIAISTLLTHDFWGNDNEYEYCIPTVNPNSITVGSVTYCSVINGFEIKGNKGSSFLTISFPNGYYCDYGITIFFHIIDDKIKCTTYAQDETGNYYTLVYDITKQSSVNNTLSDSRLVSIRPSSPRQSEPINIDFQSSSVGDKTIEVYSSSGQLVFRTIANRDCNNISIPSDYFPTGVNIVNITENGQQIYTTKIIVR